MRPEKIKLAGRGRGEHGSGVSGVVTDVVYLGSMTQLIVELPTGEL